MYFVYGKRITNRRMGYVADFCPVCRGITPLRLARVGLTGHLWYISFSKGRLLGHSGVCRDCGHTRVADATLYDAYRRSPRGPLPQLVQETFPAVREHRAAELERESLIRSGNLPAGEREAEMMGALWLFSDRVADTRGGMALTGPVAACIGLMVLGEIVLMAATILFDAFRGHPEVSPMGLGVAIFLAGMLVAVAVGFIAKRRSLRKRILPLMARCLRPLRPTRAELEYCLGRYRQAKMPLGSRVPLEVLMAELQVPAARPLPETGESGLAGG